MNMLTKTEARIVPVIMCGGSGSRLWPLSRVDHPKQYHALYGTTSLFQATVQRFDSVEFESPVVLVNKRHRDVTLAQMGELGVEPSCIVLEPAIRSTGPALAAATIITASRYPDALIIAVPADHVIKQPDLFAEAIARAIPAALDGRIVTFGIEPTGPETGYGYIQRADAIGEAEGVFAVASFVEKPAAEVAKALVAGGQHYWNAGIFLFSANIMLDELALHAPELLAKVAASIPPTVVGTSSIELNATSYAGAPEISIDHAVMEKSARLAVAPTAPGWSDVGAWSALWDITVKDDAGNVIVGDAVVRQSSNSYVLAGAKRLVALHGVRDLVVVDTPDAVLVADKANAQGIKDIVSGLLAKDRAEAVTPKRVERPWGSYESVSTGPGYQVKHIVVKPGGRLSLQFHHHRSEHWTVVAGTAQVTIGDIVRMIEPNQSVFIPLGAIHRLENLGKIDLHLIEVQCGTYLGEDDIVRVDDVYGRAALAS